MLVIITTHGGKFLVLTAHLISLESSVLPKFCIDVLAATNFSSLEACQSKHRCYSKKFMADHVK